ncbi:DUF3726 domain-containing protein [Planktotalea sp.]|uniref:DUF3726 domain-containing protein n=1 Tax=Planktotalea sp. TaxID=2029877 RepID=UPI003D6A80F2
MRSSNEISGMVLKAARGAGMTLGCAEEFARAAPYLASLGKLEVALDLLNEPFEMPAFQEGLLSGGHPVLAVICLSDLQAAGLDVRLEAKISATLCDALSQRSVPVGPFEVDPEVWDGLALLAARILVPETEQSRLAGAGAGLSDND